MSWLDSGFIQSHKAHNKIIFNAIEQLQISLRIFNTLFYLCSTLSKRSTDVEQNFRIPNVHVKYDVKGLLRFKCCQLSLALSLYSCSKRFCGFFDDFWHNNLMREPRSFNVICSCMIPFEFSKSPTNCYFWRYRFFSISVILGFFCRSKHSVLST